MFVIGLLRGKSTSYDDTFGPKVSIILIKKSIGCIFVYLLVRHLPFIEKSTKFLCSVQNVQDNLF